MASKRCECSVELSQSARIIIPLREPARPRAPMEAARAITCFGSCSRLCSHSLSLIHDELHHWSPEAHAGRRHCPAAGVYYIAQDVLGNDAALQRVSFPRYQQWNRDDCYCCTFWLAHWGEFRRNTRLEHREPMPQPGSHRSLAHSLFSFPRCRCVTVSRRHVSVARPIRGRRW